MLHQISIGHRYLRISVLIAGLLFEAVSVRAEGPDAATGIGLGATLVATGDDCDRFDSRVFANLAVEASDFKSLRLVEITAEGEVTVPAQVAPCEPPQLWWIARGNWPAGSERVYRLEKSERPTTDPPGPRMTIERNEESLEIRAGNSPVLRYQMGHRLPPIGIDPAYGRSAYIHPAWTPSGAEVTDEFPPDHAHQSGIFLAFTKTLFEGREPNFWELLSGAGRVRYHGLKATTDGPVYAELVVEHEHVDQSGPEERVALKETWTVRAWNLGGADAGYFVFDIESRLECAGENPLRLPPYHYGGMALRGGRDWNADRAKVVTSTGLDRIHGNHTRPRWCTLSGPVAGVGDTVRLAGITFCTHPENVRFPEPLRIHPTMPYMVFTPQHLGVLDIVPGTPHISKYRFIPHDDRLPNDVANRLWSEFAAPLQAR